MNMFIAYFPPRLIGRVSDFQVKGQKLDPGLQG